MNLHWGDTLCGVPVTPESWAGRLHEAGLVEYMGEWLLCCGWEDHATKICLYGSDGISRGSIPVEYTKPIWPLKGWAGRTDAELWREVFGDGYHIIYRGKDERWCILVERDGGIELDTQRTNCKIDPAALILALGNARTLAARLQGATK